MRNLALAIKAAFKVRFMYAVIVPEYRGIHWTWTWHGAQAWLRCYPRDTLRTVVAPTGWLQLGIGR